MRNFSLAHTLERARPAALALALAGLMPLAAPALAQSPPSVNSAQNVQSQAPAAPVTSQKDWQAARERLVFLFSGYEFFPSRAQLDEVAKPEVIEALLVELAEDKVLPPSQRTKAVDAMGFYQSTAHVAYLQGVLSSPLPAKGSAERRGARSLRHHAMMAVAKIEGEGSVKRLEPFLGDADVQYRLTAINALGKHAGQAGRALLEGVRAKDTNLAVQREIAKFLDAGPAQP